MRTITTILPACAVLLAVADAQGRLIQYDATLQTRTQEFVNGEALSFDESFEDFNVTSAELPLRVASRLNLDATTGAVGAAAGFVDFFEPQPTGIRNPQELGLEAGCYSGEEDVSYLVISAAQETRTVEFDLAELGLNEPREQVVISQVFVSGVILVWSQDPGRDLEGVFAETGFAVERLRPGQPETEAEELLRARVGVAGDAEGEVAPFVEGDVGFVFGDSNLVRELIGNVGDLDLLGEVWVAIVPRQQLPYAYGARPEQQFDLRVTFSVSVANAPDGVGVAAVFGRDFDALSDLLLLSARDVDVDSTLLALNEARGKARVPAESQESAGTPAAGRPGALCGAMGGEMLALLPVFLLLPLVRNRRR